MEVKDYKQTIRTTDVVHIYDQEKDINWFIAFEKLNGVLYGNAREMINYDFFRKQGPDYMQQVYDLAYKHIENIENKRIKRARLQ